VQLVATQRAKKPERPRFYEVCLLRIPYVQVRLPDDAPLISSVHPSREST
jgi:hypothetical protein